MSFWERLQQWLASIFVEQPSQKNKSASQKRPASLKKSSRRNKPALKTKATKVTARRKPSSSPHRKDPGRTSSGVKRIKSTHREKQQPITSKGQRKKRAAKKVSPSQHRAARNKKTNPIKGKIIGRVTHYFDRIQVIVIDLDKGNLKVGDHLVFIKNDEKIHDQKVLSLQVESKDVKQAKKGQKVGVKVDCPVRVGSVVLRANKK